MNLQDPAVQSEISLAYRPPTRRQTCSALAGAAVLLLGLAVLIPFAAIPLPKVDGFITALDAVISVTDLITAGLLLAHHSFESALGAGVRISLFRGDCGRSRADLPGRCFSNRKFRRKHPHQF
jgi:hypothetical protein